MGGLTSRAAPRLDADPGAYENYGAFSGMRHLVKEKLSIHLKVFMSHTINVKRIKWLTEAVTLPSGAVGAGNKDVLYAIVHDAGPAVATCFPSLTLTFSWEP